MDDGPLTRDRRLIPHGMNAYRFLLLAPLVATALPAAAQERLPNLTPAVVTVVGSAEGEAALPPVERQPLSGFGPPPRTYVVPAEREATVGPYAPDLATLGAPALPAPTPPPLSLEAGRYGRVAAGGGRFASIFGRVDLSIPTGPGALVADVDYDGLGLEIGDADHVEYARLHGSAAWRGAGRVRPQAEVGLLFYRYSLPGAGIGSVRRVTGFRVGAGVEGTASGVDFGGALRYAGTRLGADNVAGGIDEGRFDAEARLGIGIIALDGAVGTAGRDGPGDDLVDFAAGGALRLGRPGGARLTVGARALGYEASPANGSGSSTVVAPTFIAEVPMGPTATLFARTEGRLTRRGLADLLLENPFVVDAPTLAPDVRQFDGAAGVEVRSGAIGLRLAAEGAYAPTYAIFDRSPGGLYAVSYERARILGGAADITITAPSGAEASVGVAFRSGALTEAGDDIPLFAPVVGHAGVQVPLPNDRGRVGLSGAFYGPRPTDRFGTSTLPAAGTLTFEGLVRVAGRMGVMLRAERLLGPAEHWQGFPQAPFTVQLGAQLVW